MKRTLVLGALLGIGALSLTVSAYQAQSSQPKVVETEQVRDNLYMLKGGGGNTAVFIGSTGVVVVDTKNPGWGQPILDAIKALTPKPVTTIINTHTHGDHVSGNVEFPATVDIVVQENTKANMERMAAVTGLDRPPTPNIFTENGGRGMAKRTFTDRMTLGAGADRIDLYYFGRGHTNGDAWIVFPSLHVVHAGDIFSGKNLPLLDANNGGSGVDIGESLSKAADTITDVDTIITGHSTLMDWDDLREYAQFNKDFLAEVSSGIREGRTVDQIAADWKLDAKYEGYQIQQARLKTNVQVIANELKK
jgi:glyoxylase-like metal-dependent hydrolase (beta-lactamase superfamily II)